MECTKGMMDTLVPTYLYQTVCDEIEKILPTNDKRAYIAMNWSLRNARNTLYLMEQSHGKHLVYDLAFSLGYLVADQNSCCEISHSEALDYRKNLTSHITSIDEPLQKVITKERKKYERFFLAGWAYHSIYFLAGHLLREEIEYIPTQPEKNMQFLET